MVLVWSFLFGFLGNPCLGQEKTLPSSPEKEAQRMENLETTLDQLFEENRRLFRELETVQQRLRESTQKPKSTEASQSTYLPNGTTLGLETVPTAGQGLPSDEDDELISRPDSRFRIEYDNGFVIVPENSGENPFSLKVRSQNVFRYNGFARSHAFWVDSAGSPVPIANSSYFGIPRGRIIFSGAAFHPKLNYLLNIDYNSVTSNPIGFRAYELTYQVNRGLLVGMGQTKVPGTREWIESAFAPLQGPDRSMATTFFRPSLSQGIWMSGEPIDGYNYQAMISNGFNTLNLEPQFLNNRFCYSVTNWWEPWGDFGRGYSDLQDHFDPAIRLGASATYALGRGNQAESDAVENSPVRFSDGTIITTQGALGPGLTVQSYDLFLGAIDFACKYRGLGVSTELFFQELLDLQGNARLPLTSTNAFGAMVQGGYFLQPQRTEIYSRGSFVTGRFGSGSEFGCGLNWFPMKGVENLRYTFDAAWLASSPAGQNRTGFVAGQTGMLIRTQVTLVY